jgi:hypothetical protein
MTTCEAFQRRFGRFRISRAMIVGKPALALALLRGVLVVSCDMRWDYDGNEYVGLSDAFRPIPEGSEAPIYTASVEEIGPDVYRVQWFEGFELRRG